MECASLHPTSSDEIESELVKKHSEAMKTASVIRWGGCFCAVPQDPTIEVETLLSEGEEGEEMNEEEIEHANEARELACFPLNPISASSHNARDVTTDAMPILISATDSTNSDDDTPKDEDDVTALPSSADFASRKNKNSNFTLLSSLDFVADRFADLLCPGSAVVTTHNSGSSQSLSTTTKSAAAAATTTVALKNSNTDANLQRLESVSSLVSLQNQQATCHATSESIRPTTPFQPATAGCTDLSLVNISPNGLEVMKAIQDWFALPSSPRSAVRDDQSRPRIRNRSSVTPTSQRSRRVTDLWSQWHAGPIALEVVHGGGIQPCPSLDPGIDSKRHILDCKQSSSPPSTKPMDPLDLCYDSDPEVIRRSISLRQTLSQRQPKYKRSRPSPITTTLDRSHSEDSAERPKCPPPSPQHANRHPSKSGSRLFARERSPSSVTEYDKASEFDVVKDPDAAMKELLKVRKLKPFCFCLVSWPYLIFFLCFFYLRCTKEIAISKMSLVFHGISPKPGSTAEVDATRPATPTSVRAWFEFGRRLGNLVVQPKLVWCPTYQPRTACQNKNCSTSRRHWALPSTLQALDLLTMVRVLQPTTLDRDLYPYARLGRTFQITSQDSRVFMFEAASRSECERFTTGLKLMVARLASIVIVRDEAMLHEFFSPWAYSPLLDKMLKSPSVEDEETDITKCQERPEVVKRLLRVSSSKGKVFPMGI